jgi:transposase
MVAAYNLGVVIRILFGVSTSRGLQGMFRAVFAYFMPFKMICDALQNVPDAAYRAAAVWIQHLTLAA